MESFNEKNYCALYPLCTYFIKHYCYYTELHKVFNSLKGDKEFWGKTNDAHIEMATIYWCMVFGADSNATHWKNLRLDENEFRDYLLQNLNIDKDTWEIYNKQVKDFRNNYVAHRGLELYNNPVPNLSLALKSTLCLDNWIRKKFAAGSFTYEEMTIYYTNTNQLLSELYEKTRIEFDRYITSLTGIG